MHLLIDGVRLKTVPSRLTAADLGQLLAEGATPAGPPPVTTGPVTPGGPVEVGRLVNACGLVALAWRQHPVGIHFAGLRVTVRIDRGVLQLSADGVLLRSLPKVRRPRATSIPAPVGEHTVTPRSLPLYLVSPRQRGRHQVTGIDISHVRVTPAGGWAGGSRRRLPRGVRTVRAGRPHPPERSARST